jgi:hypothetical protein
VPSRAAGCEPPSRPTMNPLTLEAAAALAGEHCWVERRLFELLGQWSARTRHAPSVLALDRHSQHAAWRAEQWWARLPILAQIDRNALVAPGPSWRALADPALADPAAPFFTGPDVPVPAGSGAPGPAGFAAPGGAAAGGADPGLGRLAVAYRVLLPRLVVAYGRHAGLTTPVADGPVIRTLGHVRPDLLADWAEGEGVLQDLLGTDELVEAAAAAVAAAEVLLRRGQAVG